MHGRDRCVISAYSSFVGDGLQPVPGHGLKTVPYRIVVTSEGQQLKQYFMIGVLATAVGVWTQSSTAKKGGNPEAAKIKNPVAATPESIAAGKRSYQRLCVKCHGPEGKGDGTAATGAQPPDLTDAQWDFGSSDGEMFTAIRDGTSPDMEGYKERLSETEMWNIVNYVKSLSGKR
jgi:mono/diheme cytochrome c family protein